jgi:hypothetical protein
MRLLFVAGVLAMLGCTIACSPVTSREPRAGESGGCAVVATGAKGVFTPLMAFAAALVLLRRGGGNRPRT